MFLHQHHGDDGRHRGCLPRSWGRHSLVIVWLRYATLSCYAYMHPETGRRHHRCMCAPWYWLKPGTRMWMRMDRTWPEASVLSLSVHELDLAE